MHTARPSVARARRHRRSIGRTHVRRASGGTGRSQAYRFSSALPLPQLVEPLRRADGAVLPAAVLEELRVAPVQGEQFAFFSAAGVAVGGVVRLGGSGAVELPLYLKH